MYRNFVLCLGLITLCSSLPTSQIQAYDPNFGFFFGYSVAQANQFRNRLPAPPYFSIYPPVYYGERYARPYGESPYASWPLLAANPEYRPEAVRSPVYHANPHAGCHSLESIPSGTPPITADSATEGKMMVVENPFVISQTAVVSK